MIDYTTLDEEQFQAHCAALYAEQDRRSKLASIPDDIKKLSQDFEALGGNKDDLVAKINEPVQLPPNTDIESAEHDIIVEDNTITDTPVENQ